MVLEHCAGIMGGTRHHKPGGTKKLDTLSRLLAHCLLFLLLCTSTALLAQDTLPNRAGPFHVAGFLLEGNAKTNERIILRELTFHEGDTLSAPELYDRLARSRDNILNLGLFNTVNLMPMYLGPREVFINIAVDERWFWWPKPMFRFADPNFNTWWLTKDLRRLNFGLEIYRYNLRGRNETLIAKVQVGYAKEYGLTYKLPFIDHRQHWGLQVGGMYGEQDEVTIGTIGNKRIFVKTPLKNIIQRWRANTTFTLRRTHDVYHNFTVSWAHLAVRDTVVQDNPLYLSPGAASLGYVSYGYSFVFDQRDSRIFPLCGSYARLLVEHNGIGPHQPDITSMKALVQRSWKVAPRWSVGGNVGGKFSRGTRNHYFLQEGLGYEDYLRGYEYYVIDGQRFFLAKVNVLFALVKPRTRRVESIPFETFRNVFFAVYLNPFTDMGFVRDRYNGEANFLANRWQQSYGLGIDILSSYDQTLRVDWAVNRMGETGFYLHFTHPF